MQKQREVGKEEGWGSEPSSRRTAALPGGVAPDHQACGHLRLGLSQGQGLLEALGLEHLFLESYPWGQG
jgi:hypothetical protein